MPNIERKSGDQLLPAQYLHRYPLPQWLQCILKQSGSSIPTKMWSHSIISEHRTFSTVLLDPLRDQSSYMHCLIFLACYRDYCWRGAEFRAVFVALLPRQRNLMRMDFIAWMEDWQKQSPVTLPLQAEFITHEELLQYVRQPHDVVYCCHFDLYEKDTQQTLLRSHSDRSILALRVFKMRQK